MWTKRSRGAPQAALRGTVPVAVPVPIPPSKSEGQTLVVHEVHYAEGNAFQQALSTTLRCQLLSTTINLHNLALTWVTDGLRIDMAWEDGAPWRRFGHTIMTLPEGQWGRVRLNYRSPTEDSWRYDLWVLNIGLFGALHSNVFGDMTPLKDYADLVDLW